MLPSPPSTTLSAWRRTFSAVTPPGGWPEAGRTASDVTPGLRLSGSLESLGAVFESTGDPIWSVDRHHRLQAFNSAYALTMEALTGYAPRVGQSPEEIVPEELVRFIRTCYDRALAGHRFSVNRDQEMDGTLRSWELFFHPSEGPDGAPSVVVFSRDITRRRQTEADLKMARLEAEEANRAKSHFMANMSHELRTPLNSVIGFANILLKRHQGEESGRDREFLERIVANGNHLLTLINQILDLSKIESGKVELDLEDVDLRELVPSVIRQLEGQVQDRPLRLEAGWTVAPRPFLADAGKLRQVLINLVGNAIKFTEAGTVTVEVEADPEDGRPLAIHVRDTGIGIPEDCLEDIFKVFRQADGTTARRFGGTGLGLTISRSLCQVMGLQLGVKSKVGEGSVFTLYLDDGLPAGSPGLSQPPARDRWVPEDNGSEPAPGIPLVSASSLRELGVAVVSHRPELRSSLAEYLREMGLRVTIPAHGREALLGLRSGGIDVAILDFLMPGMSGWEVLEEFRRGEASFPTESRPEVGEQEAGSMGEGPDEMPPGTKERGERGPDPVILLTGIPANGAGAGWDGAPSSTLRVDLEPWGGLPQHLSRALERSRIHKGSVVLLMEEGCEPGDASTTLFRDHGLVVHRVGGRTGALELLARMEVDLVVLRIRSIGLDHFGLLAALGGAATGSGRRPPPPVLVVPESGMRDDVRASLRRLSMGAGATSAPSTGRIALEVKRLLDG
ncbi:MAG: PAS domain S-box protein [Gemmatimonadales bacterium]|nr:MAG: PAS domain S-box protein [Gemmatimonadales bacterium]